MVTYGIIGITVVISFLAFSQGGSDLLAALWLDKRGLAAGEWWRLVTPVLVHGGLLHLLFNMYFLYLVGPLVEQLYGPVRFLLLYVLTAAAGSAASYLFGGPAPSVGASGAIFGLCGVLLAVSAVHRPILDRRGRAIMSQIGALVVLNLIIGFGFGALLDAPIDNSAHIGGLLAVCWASCCRRSGPPSPRTGSSRRAPPRGRAEASAEHGGRRPAAAYAAPVAGRAGLCRSRRRRRPGGYGGSPSTAGGTSDPPELLGRLGNRSEQPPTRRIAGAHRHPNDGGT